VPISMRPLVNYDFRRGREEARTRERVQTLSTQSYQVIQVVHFTGLLNVQNILSAGTGIARQTEGHSFDDHPFSG
jgi:hypothetical protein